MSAAERRLDLINLPVQGQNVYESNEAIAARWQSRPFDRFGHGVGIRQTEKLPLSVIGRQAAALGLVAD